MTQAGSGRERAAPPGADDGGELIIYTDGGCRRNPGLGAWAAVILSPAERQEICGVESRTTNNRMELTAAIEALRTLEPGRVAAVITDSDYLRRGVTEWLPRWIARGWKTASKKPVLNRDLWEQLNGIVAHHEIEWKWVRGHSGERENERCDELVNEAMDKYESGELAGGNSISASPSPPSTAERPTGGRNVEIKARVADLDDIMEKALAIAAGPPRLLRQTDTFYCVPQGRLKLREQDQHGNEIIFYERPDVASPKPSSYSIARVEDPQALDRVLREALGVRGVVRKRRTLLVVGQTRVHLDHVDGLGDFIELEVVLTDDQDAEEGKRIAERLMGELGIEESDLLGGAYIDLL